MNMNSFWSPGSSRLSRRTFLRGAGVALTLPLLDAMLPAGKAAAAAAAPRRMLAIETNMGILPQFFFPDRPGRDYAPTPYPYYSTYPAYNYYNYSNPYLYLYP